MKKICVAILTLIFTINTGVYAYEPYQGYCYNSRNERTPSPNGYLPVLSITGQSLGLGAFSAPSDICVSNDNKIYILDTGKNCVVVLRDDFTLEREIYFREAGTPWQFKNALGIFITVDGEIFIADRDNGVVIKSDNQGNIIKKYTKPKTDLIDENTIFAPKKVAVDSSGTIYILSDNISNGAVVIDPDGNFLNFFGANKVEMSLDILNELFWRKFSTKEQIKQRTSIQPADYSNFYIDRLDFIYTSTLYEGISKGQIKKFNPKSTNVLEEKPYGDLTPFIVNGNSVKTALVDVASDRSDFFFALDGNQGKVFSYSPSAELMIVFGSMGYALGNFEKPVAIDTLGEKVLVLDSVRRNITVFEPTAFGKYMRQAVSLHEKGQYSEALEPWEHTLKLNSNYEPAYIGIGRALFMIGDYSSAMKYYKLGYERQLFSKALKKYRDLFLRRHFTAIIVITLLIWIAVYIFIKKRKYILKINTTVNKGGEE